LQKKIRYTLGKEERLKSRKGIEQLFKKGKSFSVSPFRVVWQYQTERSGKFLQAGFSVSTKHFKKAVERNRIRRLIKEAYRLQKNELQKSLSQNNKQLAMFLIYTDKEIPAYTLVVEKMFSVMERLKKIVNENNSPNN
jgi:ribonuclease P protein component